jgi:hypothetical protein
LLEFSMAVFNNESVFLIPLKVSINQSLDFRGKFLKAYLHTSNLRLSLVNFFKKELKL